ncbi:hypothetical protein SeLEV6574_g08385 [Synchytrium endobioticum]|uniref:DNA-directed DNA polymerase n=2 Tax=Synchytrium endobioticum TaxID=286115 RepID=A0A507C610_9FUNG|nr:hypothetical protein SeLEV6574_g08385 [Synchytrium endobioticum]
MPFGPKQAPSHMQRFVSESCKDFMEEGWLVNILDDFVIKTVGTIQLHKIHITRYLQRIQELGVYIKLSKCVFFAKEVTFVGFKVNKWGYWKQPEKMETIRKWGVPRSAKDIRKFLGYVNFYRPFANHLSITAKPLYDLTKKNAKWKWGDMEEKSFTDVKEELIRDVFLVFPDHERTFYLSFDSSDLGTGAVLQQQDENGNLRPLEFYSKKWNAAEFNYSTPDKELYGLVLALQHWYPWLYGARKDIVVFTDHKSLRDFSKTQLLKPRHARWALILEDFRGRMKIKWIPGKHNVLADTTSRDPNFYLGEAEIKERAQHQMLDPDMFDSETISTVTPTISGPPCCFVVLSNQDESIQPTSSSDEQEPTAPRASPVNEVTENCALEDNQGEGENEEENGDAFITHPSIRNCQPHQQDVSDSPEKQRGILKLRHDHPLAGHFGYRKTLDLILRDYWWKGVSAAVKEYVSSCDSCQRNKASRQLPQGQLIPLPIPERNHQHLTMDFIVKLPPSTSSDGIVYDSILVVVDRRSKLTHFIPTREAITAEATARLLFHKVICKHGIPESIVTDRGPQFRSRFWKALLQMLGSKASLSTAYHPQTDGQSERTNQVLEQYLRCYSSYDQNDWVENLPQAEFAYNNSYHYSIGMSPFFAVTGQDARMGNLTLTTTQEPSWRVPEAQRIKEHFDRVHRHLQSHLENAQSRYKEYADSQRRTGNVYKMGDEVMISTKNVRTERPTKKLEYRWMGPYRVKKQISSVNYEVELPSNLRIHNVFHVSLLKPYIQPSDPSRKVPKPPPIRIEDEEGYIIKDILDVRRRGRGFEYLIDWEGYGPEDRTWEPRRTLNDNDMLRKWHQKYPAKPSPFRLLAGGLHGDGPGDTIKEGG